MYHYIAQTLLTLAQLGKLLYAAKLSNPAKKRFTNRLLQFRRAVQFKATYQIPHEVKEDLRWFQAFVPDYNGKAIIRSRLTPSHFMFTDACLTGGGAILQNQLFHSQLARTYGRLEDSNHRARIVYNSNSSQAMAYPHFWIHPSNLVVRSGRTKNAFLAACIRELWYLCATSLFPTFLEKYSRGSVKQG